VLPLILFYVFATGAGAYPALGVIVARNPVYCALSSGHVLRHQRGIWLLIEAEFLAIVLVLVYVGAVMVLFLFVVMMLDINLEEAALGLHALRLARVDHRRPMIVRDRRRGRGATLGVDVTRGRRRCRRLQQHAGAGRAAVHQVRLSV
jgi:hypothetical protein